MGRINKDEVVRELSKKRMSDKWEEKKQNRMNSQRRRNGRTKDVVGSNNSDTSVW